ncbi:MAG: tRNA pseudouridine(38-40) synthase TruA [Gammaproteobacteria bacterium]
MGALVNLAIGLEYDGTRYAGWQQQKNALAVQVVVEKAISAVAAVPTTTVCAGRTDSGVHALGQVVSFSCENERSSKAWIRGCNSNLPADVRLLWVRQTAADFSARFSATQRHYRYLIYNRPVASAISALRMVHQPRKLDVEKMQQAADVLVGTHDFSSYRATSCQAVSPVRTVSRLQVVRFDEVVAIDVSANAFLYHMVRNIAGVLMAIGLGDKPVDWSASVLAAQDRRCAGMTAPPHGLYLVGVDYPDWDAESVSNRHPLLEGFWRHGDKG